MSISGCTRSSAFAKRASGVDCASKAELVLSAALGFDDGRIIFSSNDTIPGEFAYAKSIGAIINFDDITMLDFFEREAGAFPKTVCMRYNPGGVYEVSNGIMDNPGDAKYGMTKEQLLKAYPKLKEMGAKRFGLHAFLASNTVTNEYYPTLAKILFEVAVEIKEKTGISLSFINLSGGVGVPYTPDKEPNDILAIGEGVHKAFDEVLVPAGLGDVSIFTELYKHYSNLILEHSVTLKINFMQTYSLSPSPISSNS